MKWAIIIAVLIIAVVMAGGFLLLCIAAGYMDDREFDRMEQKEKGEKDEEADGI